MSEVQHSDLQSAVVSVMSRRKKAEYDAQRKDATAQAILSFRRELKSAEVEDVGTVYFYDPPSVAEREAYHKHMRMDESGLSISLIGMVDGVIARVKTANGAPMFSHSDRERLLEIPARTLMSIWHAIGGDRGKSLTVEEAAKK